MADIKYIITVDSAGAVKAVKEFSSAIDGSGESSSKSEPKHASLFKTIFGAQLAYDVAKKAVGFFVAQGKEAIDGAIAQEQADRNLQAALELTGRSVEGNLKHYLDFANAQQLVTKYQDDEIQGAQTLLLNLTNLNQNGIDRAMKGAMGLATVMGVDLHTAAKQIGMALNNDAESIGRMKLKIDESLPPQQKQVAILEQLEKLYGRSTAEAETFGGQMGILGKMADEVKESFGNAIVKNETFKKLVGDVKDEIIELLESGKIAEWADIAAEAISGVARALGWILDKIDKMRPENQTPIFIGVSESAKAAALSVKPLYESLEVLKPKFNDLFLLAVNNADSWGAMAASIKKTDDELKNGTNSIINWIVKGSEMLGLAKHIPKEINEIGTGSGNAAISLSKMLDNLKKLAENSGSSPAEISKLEKALNAASASGRFLDSDLKGIAGRLVELKAKAGQDVPPALAILAGLLRETALGTEGAERSSQLYGLALMASGIAVKDFGFELKETALPQLDRFTAYSQAAAGMTWAFADAADLLGVKLKTNLTKELKNNILSWQGLSAAGELTKVTNTTALQVILDKAQELGLKFSQLPLEIQKASKAAGVSMKNTWQDWGADAQMIISNVFSGVNTLLSGMTSVNQKTLDNTLANLDAEYQARKKTIENSILDETTKATQLAALDKEFEDKKLSAKRSAAQKQKSLDIAQAISGVAQAVIAALQVKPFFPLGLAMAAMAAAMGAAQVSAIKAQPIPLAEGAVFNSPTEFMSAGGQRFVAGERGMEIMAGERAIRKVVREEVGGRGLGGERNSRAQAIANFNFFLDGKKVGGFILETVQTGIDLKKLKLRTN